jgi:DNA-binding LacI/PurR family transcriptional regulator
MDSPISNGLTRPILTVKGDSHANSISKQIVRELLRRILNEEIPIGSRIPPTEVFAKMHGVSLVTMQKCLTALLKEGYLERIPSKGTFVSISKKESALGILFGCNPFEVNSMFWQILLSSIRDQALDLKLKVDFHYNLHGDSFQPGLDKIKRHILSTRYRCLIVFSASKELYRWYKIQNIVSVLVPNITEASLLDGEPSKNWSVNTGVSHLIKQGFKRIHVISRVDHDTPVTWYKDLEKAEIQKAFVDHELDMPIDTVQYWGTNANEGYLNTIKQFSKPKSEWPDALYCNHDLLTPGILSAFEKLGIVIPRDIALMSHSNKGNVFPGTVPITSMESDPAGLARNIIRHIPKPTDSVKPKTIEFEVPLPYRFVMGRSCGEKP